jgi:hypothetical protein
VRHNVVSCFHFTPWLSHYHGSLVKAANIAAAVAIALLLPPSLGMLLLSRLQMLLLLLPRLQMMLLLRLRLRILLLLLPLPSL